MKRSTIQSRTRYRNCPIQLKNSVDSQTPIKTKTKMKTITTRVHAEAIPTKTDEDQLEIVMAEALTIGTDGDRLEIVILEVVMMIMSTTRFAAPILIGEARAETSM